MLQAEGIEFSWFRSDQHVQPRPAAIADGVAEGDGVYVLGFPVGLVGGDRNYVIVRQGAIARVRDWLAGGVKEFLVDVTIFPGNSGGPVVSKPELNAITGTKSTGAASLLGVVKSYVPYHDVAVSQQTRLPRVIFEENSGLAAVVPIDYVDEVVRAHIATRATPPPTEQEAASPGEAPETPPVVRDIPEPDKKAPSVRRKAKRLASG